MHKACVKYLWMEYAIENYTFSHISKSMTASKVSGSAQGALLPLALEQLFHLDNQEDGNKKYLEPGRIGMLLPIANLS